MLFAVCSSRNYAQLIVLISEDRIALPRKLRLSVSLGKYTVSKRTEEITVNRAKGFSSVDFSFKENMGPYQFPIQFWSTISNFYLGNQSNFMHILP